MAEINDTHITDDGARQIADAVVLRAVQDYTEALVEQDDKVIRECEAFFKSKWCSILSPVDSELIIEKCKTGATNFADYARVAFATIDGEKRNVFKCPICGGQVDICRRVKSHYKVTKYDMKAICQSCKVSAWKSAL